MTEKRLDSTHPRMKRSSFHPSIHDKEFLELLWENGEILLKGSSSNRTPNKPSCTGYSINPSAAKVAIDTTKRTRLSTIYSLLDHFPAHRDSDLSSSHSHQSNGQDSSQIDLQFSHSKSSSNKLKEDYANIRQVKESKFHGEPHQPATATTGNYSHLLGYSSQKCLPSSATLTKPRMDSSQIQATNSQKLHYLGSDQRTGKVNFSNFLIPAMFLKSTCHQGNTANNASSARLEEIEAGKVEKAPVAIAAASNKAPDQSVVIESAKGSNCLTGFQDQTSLAANKPNQVSLVARSDEEPRPLDEHSEAVGHNNSALRAKGKADTDLCNEPLLASSSVCSLGASNDPNFCTKKHEDIDDSTYSSDNDKEPEDVVKEKPAREGNRVKRSRNAEIRNISERTRRDKFNKKIRTLKELIPNCNKMDKASTLDDAIHYLKTLKLQLQIMSMGSGLCMPLMMLPAATHQINTPHLPQLVGAGMGFRPGTSIVPCTPPQFTIPPLSGITDSTLQMFGFSNQMPPMPIPHAPFIPMTGNSSTQPLMATSTATNNLVDHLANSAQLTTPEVSVPKNSNLHAKANELCSTKHALNQVSLDHTPGYPFYFPTKREEKRIMEKKRKGE